VNNVIALQKFKENFMKKNLSKERELMTKKSLKLKEDDFSRVFQMISEAQDKVWRQVNGTLISLYWNVGEYISQKSTSGGWGQGVVEDLSQFILSKDRGVRGFSARNIWRMKQFYETYKDHDKLSTLLTEVSWSNHLHILSKTKTFEEKEYYLALCESHLYSARDLARIIDSSTYERTLLADRKLSTPLTEFPVDTTGVFKDIYMFDFLGLSDNHQESTLRKALLNNFKHFLLELGPDFTLIGEEYRGSSL
jgi:predicted nuclease of restriction endonuclease-like (RecB) superfamily